LYFLAQRPRCALIQTGTLDGRAYTFVGLQNGNAIGARNQVALEISGACRVQLAILGAGTAQGHIASGGLRPLAVTCKTSYASDGSQVSPSTVGREIMYSVAHAVHHYALIGVMGGIMGLQMPPGFGVAPSTLKHQAGAAKAAA